jgi:hypothetical protein
MKQLILLLLATPVFGSTVYLNFEGIFDGNPVDDLYAGFGVHFRNATVQTKDMSLSPLFPPNDGVNVATDLPGSPMDIKFDLPYTDFSAAFTWTSTLHFFVAYNNGTVQTMDTASYANFIAAEVVGGTTAPNQVISFGKPSGIEEIAVYTDFPGNSFTIDSVKVATPEPGLGMLAGLAAVILAMWATKSRCL